MIITVGTITIPTIPVMVMEAAVSAWDLEWDGAWVCLSDMDTPIMVTLPIMDMVATTIPSGDIDTRTMDTAVITEVPTGADIITDTTMGSITVIMGAVVIIPNIIPATGIWIADSMPVIQDPPELP